MATLNTTFAPLNTIISWFSDGAQPNDKQFETSWKSFWHKGENIPVEQIYQLTEFLNLKAERDHMHFDLAKKDGSNLSVEDINGLKEVLGVALAANGIINNIETTITSEDANVLQDGIYKPKTTGVYASIGLTAKENYTTLFKKLDGVWSVFSEEKLPKLSADGKVEEGDTNAVSGWEVFEKTLVKGKDTFLVTGNQLANVNDAFKFIEGFYINNATGGRKANSTSTLYVFENPKPNQIYTISGRSSQSGARAAAVYYDESEVKSKPLDKNGIESSDYSTYGSGNASFKTRANTKRVELTVSFNVGLNTFKDTIMINEGDVALPYESYQAIEKIKKELIPDLDYATIEEVEDLLKPVDLFEFQINDTNSRVRLPYSSSEDLLWRMTTDNNSNNCYCFVAKGLISKSAEITENGTLIGNVGSDEIAPVLINNMYIGANHGSTALRIVTANSHGKTIADVGSKWVGSNGKKYYILKIVDENTLWMCSEDEGNWTFSGVPNGIFTHDSKATNTADFSVSSSTSSQLRPVVKHISKHYLSDGVKVTEDGVYKAHDLKFIEEYDIIDTTSMLDRLYANAPYSIQPDFLNGDVIATIKNVWQFVKGGAIINNEIIIKKPCNFNSFGVTQNAYYSPSWANSFMKHIPYVVVNNGFDFRKPLDFKGVSVSSSIVYNVENWQDENTPPRRYSDRTIGTTRDIIFNLGYLPIGSGYNRKDYVNNALWINTSKKTYPNAITGDKVDANDGNVVYSSSAYRIHLPKDSEVYNKVELEQYNQLFVSLDYDTVGFKRFKTDDKWIGKNVEVIASTNNIKALTSIVTGYLEFHVENVSNQLASVDLIIK